MTVEVKLIPYSFKNIIGMKKMCNTVTMSARTIWVLLKIKIKLNIEINLNPLFTKYSLLEFMTSGALCPEQ